VAFANVWQSGNTQELSPDLMRYTSDAPSGTMEYLFVKLIFWGKDRGYQYMNLGMAPLSGIDDRPLAPLWNKAVGIVYRHGQHFYSFEGLRNYKERFTPEWTPRYLASPGGLELPRIITDLTRLISFTRSRGDQS
jgi:phosphatidylglycerol lysyltransferase